MANSVDNRNQSERLLQTDSIAGVEGHQHFSIVDDEDIYECEITHLRRNVENYHKVTVGALFQMASDEHCQ